MLRRIIAILLLCSIIYQANAAHIKGGFFSYQYLGPGSSSGTARYSVTLTVYMQCNLNDNQISNPINFSIFNAGNNQFVQDVSVTLSDRYELRKNYDNPCISGNETGCYYNIIVYTLSSLELPITTSGHIISYQRCCRIAGISNMLNSGAVGNTFSTFIPGTGAETNSSPTFLVNDTSVICRNTYFAIPFQVTDPNNDSLTYTFCEAILGGTQDDPAPFTATNPPYQSVPYAGSFSGSQPLGSGVTINRQTGLISGIAPQMDGEYVVTVCVNEYNRTTGRLIATTRKELHIVVRDCNVAEATIEPEYIFCDEFTQSFANLSNSPLINSHYWDFGDPSSGTSNISTSANPTHTFSDTGIYNIKLVTNRGQLCPDSVEAVVRVYPGFSPDFTTIGTCYLSAIQFSDLTQATYGDVNFWRWDFGDPSTNADTSRNQNDSWTYASPGSKTVNFIVASDKGCRDTVVRTIDILDNPVLTLPFTDTLICNGDVLPLQAIGNGNFTWAPTAGMINPTSSSPIVSPSTTTTYHVELDENGCTSNDSVTVRVINFVTLVPFNDTTICATDEVQLSVISDGLRYHWSPGLMLNDSTLQNPIAISGTTQTYTVTATVGGCSETASINVNTVPYPQALVGDDITICYNVPAQISGSHNGSFYTWSPAQYLNNTNTLNPIVNPPRTTEFILASYDTLGCPKPGYDTILVNVLPPIVPFAGNDTSVVIGQPLQLNATGGTSYVWSPATGLDDPLIANPIGTYGPGSPNSIPYTVAVFNQAGCFEIDSLTVHIFQTPPRIFVPNAFTPNGDGLNDIIAPIAVGIERINYFRIFNRWGQEVFSTTQNGRGWDGTINGKPQASNSYVWLVSATDYLGNPYFEKGTLTLIR